MHSSSAPSRPCPLLRGTSTTCRVPRSIICVAGREQALRPKSLQALRRRRHTPAPTCLLCKHGLKLLQWHVAMGRPQDGGLRDGPGKRQEDGPRAAMCPITSLKSTSPAPTSASPPPG
jgi:hypothetical protein